jgi:hypothetical protein
MIIMIAANRMKPTAHPLVSRLARRAADDSYASLDIYRSLLCCAASGDRRPLRTTDRTIPPARAASITLLG